MFFASSLQPILSSFAPMRPERSAGPGPAQARYRWLSSVGHTQELPGSWRIHPVPLPRSRIPASSSDLTVSAQQCRPHFADSEGTDFTDLSRLNHAASVPAAYASSGALPHPHARLASGRWLALAGRESNPLDSIEKFPSATSDFLLSQVYPGATAEIPRSFDRFPTKYPRVSPNHEHALRAGHLLFDGAARSHRVGPSRSRAWRTRSSSCSAIASRSVLGGGILAATALT
jgi:hypothetical protein